MYRYPSVFVSSNTRTRSPLRNTCSGSTRTARPFESRMNNVTPRPRRRALTGVEDSDGLGPGFDGPGLTGVLSGGLFGLFEPVVDFGRRRLGLAVVPPVFAVLSFGRDVRNAPRTSSS